MIAPARTRKADTANVPTTPDTLTVILADTTATMVAIVHENEQRPYRRRTIQLKLTDEQRRQLEPRYTGHSNGKPTCEEVPDAWLEPAGTPPTARP